MVNLIGCRNGESHYWVKRSSTHLAHPLSQGRHRQASARGSANGTHDVPCVGRYSGAGCEIGHARVFRYCREKGKNRPADSREFDRRPHGTQRSSAVTYRGTVRAASPGRSEVKMQGLPRMGGMMGMGGAPQAATGDSPQVDTAENVSISSK